MAVPDVQDPVAATPPPAAPRRRLRWWWLLPLLLLVALFAGGWWLTATEAGFAALWQLGARASGGALTLGRSQGTLWRGFSLWQLRWQHGGTRLALSHAELAWRPQALWRGELHLERLALGTLTLSTVDDGAAPQPPSSLALPLAVRVDDFRLAAYGAPDAAPLLHDVRLRYRYQHAAHQLTLQQLSTPQGSADGSLRLADAAPFALAAQLAYRGDWQGVAVRGRADVAGSLLAPRLNSRADAQGVAVQLDGELLPFAPQPLQRLRRLDLRFGGINPGALQKGWPQAELALALQLAPRDAHTVIGGLSISNAAPGQLSAGRLPLALAWGDFSIRDGVLRVPGLRAQLAGGELTLRGDAAAERLALQLGLAAIDSRALHAALPAHRIDGQLQLAGTPQAPQLALALRSGALALDGRLRQAGRELLVDDFMLRTGLGRLAGRGSWGLDSRRLRADSRLQGFDPAGVDARWPAGSVNGSLQLNADLAGTPRGELALRLTDSRLSGAPLAGQASARWQATRLQQLAADLTLGGNRLQASGAWGAVGDRLRLQLAAPQLGLLGPAFGGALHATLEVSGEPTRPDIAARLQAQALTLPGGVRVASLQAQGDSGTQPHSPFRLQASGQGLLLGALALQQLDLDAAGVRSAHRLQLGLQGSWDGSAQQLRLQLQGGMDADALRWQGTLAALDGDGLLPLALQAPAALTVARGEFALAPSRWQLLGAQLQLGATQWQQGSWRSSGQLQHLALAALAPWYRLPLAHDLVLGAEWALSGQGAAARGQLALQREGGDVQLPQGKRTVALGLLQAELRLALAEQAPFQLRLQSRFGELVGDGNLSLPAGAVPTAATLDGKLALSLPSLAVLQGWLPVGSDVAGTLAAALTLRGPLLAPELAGGISGHGLRFVERKNGIRLEQGVLAARLQQRSVVVDYLTFGEQRELTASGTLALDGAQPDAAITLKLARLPLIARPGRRLTVSGDSRITLRQQQVLLQGALKVDSARMELPKLGGPSLSSDVVVLGREVVDEGGGKLPFGMDLSIALGEDFRFMGNGLDAWLGGDTRLLAEPGGMLQARGQIRVDKGRFKAYAQDLDINRGVISFNGALDNPTLDIRAKRRFSPVGAGVEISGSVLAPTVKLVADEPMSEKDKLSWLVLGRAAGVGDKADNSAGASAGGLLAGLVNDQVGLFDDVGVLSRGESTGADGTVNPAEQVVSLGKQLTRELYVGYEYGLKSAEQAIRISYQLSRQLSLIARAGREASSELRYTWRFD